MDPGEGRSLCEAYQHHGSGAREQRRGFGEVHEEEYLRVAESKAEEGRKGLNIDEGRKQGRTDKRVAKGVW